MPLLKSPPREVCILRLSAIGDTCHVVPVVRTLQRAWPGTRFTWVIGKLEMKLMHLLPGIDFITFDKRGGLGAVLAARKVLVARRFDLLLHMQVSFRASILAHAVNAPVKLGFDRARAREGQWLFTTDRIREAPRQHVLDGLFGFAEALGVHDHDLRWDLPLPDDALAYAAALVPDQRRTLVISPCSSHARRNWRPERYAAVADHAARRHGMRVILCGGPSRLEREMADAILAAAQTPVVDQVGKDTLPQLLALLARADVLVTPDSGPAHMATMVGTPVIGLYAATNPARSGPYLSRQWCVDRYAQAAEKFLGRPAEVLPWTTKIEKAGVMDLIEVEDVTKKLDALVRQPLRKRAGRT